jgi:hypothetical protein
MTVAGGSSFGKGVYIGADLTVVGTRQNAWYSSDQTARWYILGKFSSVGGPARVSVRVLGCSGYDRNLNYGGETVICASLNNNASATVANINGFFYSIGDAPAISALKFAEVNRYSYNLVAYFNLYSSHTIIADSTAGSTFVSSMTLTTDPGANSATVQTAQWGNTPLPQTVVLVNNWVNFANGYASASYYKDSNNVVFLEGLIANGTALNGTTLFTLPVGYRPSAQLIFSVSCSGTTATNGYASSRVDVFSSGAVTLATVGVNASPAGWLNLSEIKFIGRV